MEVRNETAEGKRDVGADLLAVALREVDDARAEGGEADERAGAGLPKLVVEWIPCSENQRRQTSAANEEEDCGRAGQIWKAAYLRRGLRRRHGGGRHLLLLLAGGVAGGTLAAAMGMEL